MKQRILTAAICLPVIVLLLFSPVPVVAAAVIVAALIGLYEYFRAVGIWGQKELCALGFLGGVLIPLSFWLSPAVMRCLVYLYFMLLLGLFLLRHRTLNWIYLALLALGLIYIPFALTHIVYIRSMELGRVYIWLVFLGAFMTDTCAYFVGCGCGKRKLCPEISPKKTVEGAVGGVVGCGLSFLVFGLVVNLGFGAVLGDVRLSLWRLFVMGLVCAVVSELGDLAASLIKRQYKIKDFGNLLPGHGGILDRCDSIILVAPTVFLFLQQMGVLV